MSKNKSKKLKSLKGKSDDLVSVTQAIVTLRDEIISEAKLVATGVTGTVYDLSEKTKELIQLEKMEAEKTLKVPEQKVSGDDF